MKDNYGRKINYLRVSVTDLCNLRCRYCMPKEGVKQKSHEEILTLEEIYDIIKCSSELGINKVRITGGEPLVRKGVISLIERISKIDKIKDIAMTTNGILLEKYAKELKKSGLKRVNISLDTLDSNKFKEITRGGNLEQVLKGIEVAEKEGLTPIKINTVLIGNFNDGEIDKFVELTLNKKIHVRFIELMPIGHASDWSKENFVSNETILKKFPKLIPLDNEDGVPARYYKMPGAKGKVGLINPISQHFCSTCNRIRLTADGKIKPCLHSDREIDIKKVIRNNKLNLKQTLQRAIFEKPQKHHICDDDYEPVVRDMNKIGG